LREAPQRQQVARFLQMAREYQSATLLIHKELSADLRSPLANAPAVRREAEDWGR
jgi:hypothetical protein